MKNPILYKIIRPLLVLWFYPTYRPEIINNKIIPKKGRIILAGNHTSTKDCFLLGISTKRCVRFIAKDELLKGPAKLFFKNIGLIPVNRKIKDKSVVPLTVEILKNNQLIGIFPESTVNKTEDLIMPFKVGVIKMSIESHSPIIPFAITGQYTKWKKNVKISFGDPYFPKSKNIEKEIKVLENKVIKLINTNGE